MKRLTIIFCLALISLNSFAQEELPTTEVRTLQNEIIPFNEVFEPGKVTLVSFWATWCVPCKKEIANIKELLPTWKEEMDIDFITVSEDDSRSSAKVASYASAQRWDFETYLDPNNDLKRSLNFQTVPFSMIVDGEGNVVYMHNGYEEGAENEIYEKLKEITGVDQLPIEKAEGSKAKSSQTIDAEVIKRINAEGVDAVEGVELEESIDVKTAPEKVE